MLTKLRFFRIFLLALLASGVVILVKYALHMMGWELIEQSSLHNSIISSVIFVLSFLLSATITDYKESERIPSDFSSNIMDMYDDAAAIHKTYPVFDLKAYRKQLAIIASGFSYDTRNKSYDARRDIRSLTEYFADMEKGKVPPNFVVKLKQQQTVLLRHRQRVNYIQRISFIPSATVLARSIVLMAIALLIVTEIEPFYGGLAIAGMITFIMVYILILIKVISTPFHQEGKTMDDVSLFLITDAVDYLNSRKK